MTLQRANALKQLNKEIVDKRQRQINVQVVWFNRPGIEHLVCVIQTRHSQHLAELRRKRIQSLELACHERALAKEERAREWVTEIPPKIPQELPPPGTAGSVEKQ